MGSAELARDFAAAADEVVLFVRQCTDEQWARTCEAEAWTVGALVNHIGDGYVGIGGWIQCYLEGRPAGGVADIHTDNAARAAANSSHSREDTIARLEQNAAATHELISKLTDEQLAISFPFGSVPEMKASGLAKLAARHTAGHLANARAALALSPGSGS